MPSFLRSSSFNYNIINLFLFNIIQGGNTIVRKMANLLKKKNIWGVLNGLALSVVIMNAGQCCYWFYRQPEFPAEADKYRKFK